VRGLFTRVGLLRVCVCGVLFCVCVGLLSFVCVCVCVWCSLFRFCVCWSFFLCVCRCLARMCKSLWCVDLDLFCVSVCVSLFGALICVDTNTEKPTHTRVCVSLFGALIWISFVCPYV